jgi:hypothetical protein
MKTINCVSLIVNDDDILQTLDQVMASPFNVYAGEPLHEWYGDEYWSQELPSFLKPETSLIILRSLGC